MEPTSSRETVPMSSTTLSRVRRTLTAPEPYLPQSSAHSMDELQLPFPFEVAVPRYPSLHQNLAASHGTITTAAQSSYVDTGSLWEVPDDQPNTSPAVRHRISPVKSIPDENGGLEAVAEDAEPDVDPISTIEEAPRSYGDSSPKNESVQMVEPVLDSVVDIGNGTQSQDNMPHGDENVHFTEPTSPVQQPKDDSPQPQSRTVGLIEAEEKPLKRAKTSQKKKVKRGKTTSAVVRKRVESEVEDDVIWIDEKKSMPAIIDDTDASDDILGLNDNDGLFNMSAHTRKVEPVAVIPQKIEVQVQIPTDATDKPDIQVNPTPKKRGRKRKKADQGVISIQGLPKQAEELKLDVSIEDENCYIPPASPQPPSFVGETAKDQTPEPNIDYHALHESTKSPNISVDRKSEPAHPIETPKKTASKGPDKHSPIAVTTKVAYRVGLSRKARIAPLLKVVRK